MGPIPGPLLFEGFIVGAAVGSSLVPRVEAPMKKDKYNAGLQMSSALKPLVKRMSITDLSRIANDDSPDLPNYLEAHFNPTEMRETIKVIWSEIPIPGMSHKRLQYHLTENIPFQFDLHFDALQATGANSLRGQDGPGGIASARRFLQSLCFAKEGAQTVQDGAPPRILFYWPNFLSLTCVVAQEDWRYTMFQTDGAPRRFTCSMQLKEIRDTRLLSNDVLRGGSKRNSPPVNSVGGRDDMVIKV